MTLQESPGDVSVVSPGDGHEPLFETQQSIEIQVYIIQQFIHVVHRKWDDIRSFRMFAVSAFLHPLKAHVNSRIHFRG